MRIRYFGSLLLVAAVAAWSSPIVHAAPITVAGTFVSIDSCAPCSGLGTNELQDGIAGIGSYTNLFRFDGSAGLDVGLGDVFVIGTFTFRNGRVGGTGTPPTYFDLHITTNSPDPAFDQLLQLRVHYTGTPAVPNNPAASADYVAFEWLGGTTQFGQAFRVYEQVGIGTPASVGQIQLLASINSIHYEGFGRLLTPDTAFVTATSEPNDLTPVPEPASMYLLAIGLAGLTAKRWKQSRGWSRD